MTYFQVEGQPAITRQLQAAIYLDVFFTLAMFICMLTVAFNVLPMAEDAGLLVSDARTTMADINVILPEVREMFRMMERLCQDQQFAFLCDDA